MKLSDHVIDVGFALLVVAAAVALSWFIKWGM